MSVHWMRCVGQLPLGAVIVGYDQDGSSLYAGRAYHEGDLLPAKVKPNQQVAHVVAWGGTEHPKHDYEVMVARDVGWQRTCDGYIPARAVVVGHTVHGEPLYTGRALHADTLTPGKVQPSHGCLYIPFAGNEIPVTQYEIMVVNVAPAFVPPETDRHNEGSTIIGAFVCVCLVLIIFVSLRQLQC